MESAVPAALESLGSGGNPLSQPAGLPLPTAVPDALFRFQRCPRRLGLPQALAQRGDSAETWGRQRFLRWGFAMVSLWVRYGFGRFAHPPSSRSALCALQPTKHSPPYYIDAAASKEVTALCAREFTLRPATGQPCRPLLGKVTTSRWNQIAWAENDRTTLIGSIVTCVFSIWWLGAKARMLRPE